jgi:Uma2 family endonuclease
MSVEVLTESPVSPPATVGPYRHADYLALPDEPRCELIFGRFYVTPAPTGLHQFLLLLLARRFDELAETTGGLALVAPLDVHLADHSTVQPDVLYFTREHRNIVGRSVEGAPDLVVEVLSPATGRRDRGEKLRLYADSGVSEYWIIDPVLRQIDFLINRGGRFQVALAIDGIYRSEAVPDVVFDLAAFWSEVERRGPASN